VFNINDMPQENISLLFDEAVDFIKNGIDSEEAVLVHCNAGVSRSPSFVIAYFMKELSMSFDDALSYVQGKRSIVFPNQGFVRQLKAYGEQLS
jgi:protein-tyrosine phosphatase